MPSTPVGGMRSLSSWREVYLYTDGSCLSPHGPGGWAFLLRDAETGEQFERSGAHAQTTNNRMELAAVIHGLAELPERSRVHLVTDSQYVHFGITENLEIWIDHHGRTSGGGHVENWDLWRLLAHFLERHDVDSQWVRGHSGHPENERVDFLAHQAAEQLRQNAPNGPNASSTSPR